jgi:AraC-like DNA-binding protein
MVSEFFVSILASVGVLQGILISAYLILGRNKNDLGSVFLGVALFGLTLRILKSVLNYYLSLSPLGSSLGLSGILLTGPFLLFYTQILVRGDAFRKIPLLHFVPFVIYLIGIPFLSASFHRYFNYWVAVIHLGGYLIFILYWCFKSRRAITLPKWRWLGKIILGICLIWLFYLINLIGGPIHYLTSPIQYSFFIYWFTILLLSEQMPVAKYRSSVLSKHESERIYRHLIGLFRKEELYTHPELSLELVANRLNVTSRIISQVVNENSGENFKSFVNRYRIKKAKAMLNSREHSNDKIAAIAYDVGYNNLTSFNTTFKQLTGETPSQFRRRVETKKIH